ncbi:coiled-coil domain-containing protein 125 isoform X2 [Apodemus sylvaticus]|uniref:coiled-coil domain-containing protein 125 isoform X2 n=1 Tax=Apodemus sylvaticus TaxID=10129 RepID=UPI00224458F2|nr:coiled-coil domain-containing protein 125 isoform X2 [Apodemus sylvaticus]
MSRVSRSSSEAEDIWETEDDMTKGDLGYGLGRKPGGIYEVPRSITSKKRSDGKNPSPPSLQRKGEERSETIFQCSRNKGVRDTCADGGRAANYRRLSSTDSNSELSDEQLRRRLHEALEEVEILKTELEASQRQLEGKEEALKILQSMVMLGKATSHTQAMLQKTIEQKKSLEKEINALQWEMEFDQDRFKNIEESWIQKYDRLNCDNAVLREDLKLRTEEIRMLKSENAVLNQRYLEALAMLDIRQQKMAQENMGQEESGFTEVSGLELAVLGACLCHGPGGSPCSCARMAASTRKLVLQLRHELNDKEEALAHQRKVSYMLARALEDKDTASKRNKEKIPVSQTFPFKTAWQDASELRGLHDPLHANHVSEPVGCNCSIQHPQKVSDCSRTLKRSRSLPSNL